MLLSQVIFGAALTALGASNSSHTIITILGALNTIIAGLIAWLKSRGQPMRARMFRDDLNRVVDEIENSSIMWLGISRGAHGYDAIDQDEVTVRSEVARLTRHYDKAVRDNTKNDPDNYANGIPDGSYSAALRTRPQGQPGSSAPVEPPVVVPAVATVPDDSPATQPNKPADGGSKDAKDGTTSPAGQPKVEDTPKEASKDDKPADAPTPATAPAAPAPTVPAPAPVPPNPGPVNTTTPAPTQSRLTEEGEDDSPATALAGSKALHKTTDDKSKNDSQRDSVMGDSGISSGSDSKEKK